MARSTSLRRRDLVVRGLLVAVLAASAFLVTVPERGSAAGAVLFGANPALIDGSRTAGVLELEALLGREMDLVRDFERWDSQFPAPFHEEMIDSDRLLIISVRAKRKSGTKIQWADIANAQPGDQLYDEMVGWVEGVRDLGVPVWFAFHHEPESAASSGHGTDAEFKAAFQRFVDEFRSRGVTNVEFAWIMTSWSFETSSSDARYAEKWYPGDDYVDHIGADTYNWDHCRDSSTDSWRKLEDTAEGQRQFGLDHPDKGLFFGEIASTELPGDNGAAKANWIAEVQDLLKQPGWEQFEAVSWFNVIDDSYPNCLWPVGSSTAALNAWIEMGNDPFYGGDDGGSPATTTTQPTTTTTSATTATTVSSTTTTTPTTTTTTTTPPDKDRKKRAKCESPPCKRYNKWDGFHP